MRTVAGFASAVVFVIAVNLMLDHRPPHLPGWGGHILGRVDQTEFVRLAGQRRLARRRVGRCPVGGTVGVVVRALVASDPARGSAAFAGVRNRTARPGSGAVAALIGAVLFGATVIGISIALAAGRLLGCPGAVALLTSGYSVGQILGPVAVTPLLRQGFSRALPAAMVVLLSALVAGLLRFGFPSAGADPCQAATSPRRRRPILERHG